MRCLALLLLVSGCMEVISLEDASVKIAPSNVGISLPVQRCYALDRSLVGRANGLTMRIVSRGDKDQGANTDPEHDGYVQEPYTCHPPRLLYPPGLGLAEEVTIDISDDTATLTTAYPAPATPPQLALVSTEMVDGRFAITVDPTPRAHLIASDGASRTTDDGRHEGVDIRVVPDGRRLQLVFPARVLDPDETYVLGTTSTFAATSCDGFTHCFDGFRRDHVELDPAWIELANEFLAR